MARQHLTAARARGGRALCVHRPRRSSARSALVVGLLATTAPASAAADTRAPVISGVTARATGATTVAVSWTTDEAATSQVAYGTTTAYGSTTSRSTTLSRVPPARHQRAPGRHHLPPLRARGRRGRERLRLARGDRHDLVRPTTFNPGNTTGTVAVPSGMGLEDVSRPDRVVGTGTAASCTSAAVLAAAAAGGVVTFSCGPNPVTITLSQTIKVRNSTAQLVLDGGGKVTLSGGGARRILYVDTCDTSLGTVSGNCLYAPTGPRLTVQNLTFADGNATSSTYVSPGDTNQGCNGGGAIFQLGGRLKVVRSVFVRNACATNGPDLGGGAIRVLAQHSATPNDLDHSYAARNQDPVAIVQSTFGGASGQGNRCSNGGAISGLRTPITVVNSKITDNSAVGCCANPPRSGHPGRRQRRRGLHRRHQLRPQDLRVSVLERNSAKAGGSAIFYVSNDLTGHLSVQSSVSRNNTYAPNGQPNDAHFETYPGIFYRGSGSPSFTGSTIQ